jgi:oligopeptide/dipeptide ABC transporter ATP-binding protein
MYLGKVMEEGPCDVLFKDPKHPYTKALLSATPIPNPRRTRERDRIILKGEVPSPIDPPKGCRFLQRCPYSNDKCAEDQNLIEVGTGHRVACHVSVRR